jgi:hypothetical protein
MMPFRSLPRPGRAALALIAGLAACGGGGGPSDDPGGGGAIVLLQKPPGSGDAQTGEVRDTLPVPLTVLVTEGGAPAAGFVVTFTPLSGAGSVVPAVDTTGGDGLAGTTWVLGTASGVRQVRALVSGGMVAPLIFSATVQPGPPAQLTVSGGGGQLQEAGVPFPSALGVRIVDEFGNNVPGVAVQWEVTSGSASLGAASSNTGTNGVASVAAQAGGTPGPAVVRATSIVVPGDTVTFDLTVVPAASIITVSNNFFTPAVDTIPVGGAVRWVWNGGTHDVSPVSGPATFPASMSLAFPSQYGPILLTTAGTYTYECTIHPGMVAAIVVQ